MKAKDRAFITGQTVNSKSGFFLINDIKFTEIEVVSYQTRKNQFIIHDGIELSDEDLLTGWVWCKWSLGKKEGTLFRHEEDLLGYDHRRI